jgi:hypothetical protein
VCVTGEQDVVVPVRVERRVEIHKIDRLRPDVLAEHFEVVAVVEKVLVHRGTSLAMPSARILSGHGRYRCGMTDARCPECGSTDVARIVYGYPAGKRREPNTVDGGCRCWGDERDPQFACRTCQTWFGAVVPVFPDLLPD